MGQDSKTGHLGTTLATWAWLLDGAGHPAADPSVRAACDRIRAAGEGDDVDALGRDLVGAVAAALPPGADTAEVAALARRWYGDDRVAIDFGADRDARVQAARAYQFRSSLPWLARIIDRFPDGSVGAHWVMVERVTDVVTCMDPYPWDDRDEEAHVPLVEFLVKWELAGAEGVRFV